MKIKNINVSYLKKCIIVVDKNIKNMIITNNNVQNIEENNIVIDSNNFPYSDNIIITLDSLPECISAESNSSIDLQYFPNDFQDVKNIYIEDIIRKSKLGERTYCQIFKLVKN